MNPASPQKPVPVSSIVAAHRAGLFRTSNPPAQRRSPPARAACSSRNSPRPHRTSRRNAARTSRHVGGPLGYLIPEPRIRYHVLHRAASCCTLKLWQNLVTPRERITVNLAKAQHRELQALAKQHNVSMSWIGQVAIERLLDQHKHSEFQFPLDLERRTS